VQDLACIGRWVGRTLLSAALDFVEGEFESYALTTLPLRKQEVQTRMRLSQRPLWLDRAQVNVPAPLGHVVSVAILFPNCGPLRRYHKRVPWTAPDEFRT